jgi:mono/diheme cytochrome c family protein
MAQGRELYTDNCVGCHKENGKGGKITIEGKSIDPDDLTAQKIKDLPDDRLYRYIHNGIEDEGMPAFKDKLSEAEIREVVRYIRVELQNMPDPSARPRQ